MKRFSRVLLAVALPALLAATSAQAGTITRTTAYEYDTNGKVTKETLEPDSPNDCLQTSYTYNSTGSKTSVNGAACAGASGYTLSSVNGTRTTTIGYAGGGTSRFPETKTNAVGHTTIGQYDAAFGNLLSQTPPLGISGMTNWQYDVFGRRTKQSLLNGPFTTWKYMLCTDSGASCPSTVGPATVVWVLVEQGYVGGGGGGNTVNSPEKRQFYDALNRVVRSQTKGFDGGGTAPTIVADTEYNAIGKVYRQSKPYALSGGTPVWTTYTYDELGRIKTESRPDVAAPGGTATTTYTYDGLTTTATNSKGQTKTAIKNSQGQIAQVIDAKNSPINYSYDAAGQLTQVNVAGSITSLGYNQRGQKTSMVDPAMGAWEYRYNAFGELVWQRDSLNQQATMEYDAIGRLKKRIEPDLTSQWSWDRTFDGSACGNYGSAAFMCEAKSDNGYRRLHTYDNFGRPTVTSTFLDNPSVPSTVTETYAASGYVSSKTWPTGYKAKYTYTALGYLQAVTATESTGANTVSYTVLAMNAQGQVTQYKTGNQVTTVKTFDSQTSRLQSILATTTGQSSGNVMNQAYTWDSVGNLATRADNTAGIGTQESFSYDAVNRLTLSTILGGAVSPPQVVEAMYDDRDNITYKSDVGRYWYDADRPNRMTNVTLETAPGAQMSVTGTRALSYAFDDLSAGAQTVGGISVGNGNLQYTVSQDTVNGIHTVRGESYTSFNMPKEVVYGNLITPTTSTADRTLTFVYGPEHQRIKQTVQLSGTGTSSYTAGTTWTAHGIDSLGLTYEKAILANGVTENKHYVSAQGIVFALHITRSGTLGTLTTTTTSYLHQDQQGSVTVVTDKTGAVAERMAYDPWGKRRQVNGNPDVLDSIVGAKTDRGYTMQEHLDEIGVIHMNARVYDPLIGRFMSADSVIPNPFDMKAFNRYSYAANNPLRYVDPTGHFFDDGPDSGGGGGGDGGGLGGDSGMPTGDWGPDGPDTADNLYDPRDAASKAGGFEIVKLLPNLPNQPAGSVSEYMDQRGLVCSDCSSLASSSGAGGLIPPAQMGPESNVQPIVSTTSAITNATQVAMIGHVQGLSIAGATGGATAIAVNRDTLDRLQAAWDQLTQLVDRATDSGPLGVQYALVATRNGLYPTVGGEVVMLNRGDVWKFGVSINPGERYNDSAMQALNLRMDIQSVGTQSQVLVAEKLQLIGYFLSNSELPPGNRIFK